MAIAVALIVFAGSRLLSSGFRWDLFRATLAGIHPGWATGSVALALGAYVVRALRWRVMIAPVRPEARLRGLLAATMIGFTAVVFFGRPGEFVRPWLIAVRERVPVASQLAIWFLERIFDLLSVVLLFGFSLSRLDAGARLSPKMHLVMQAGGYMALVAGFLCIAVLVMSTKYSDSARSWCNYLAGFLPRKIGSFVVRSMDAFLSGMRSTGSRRSLLRISAWTALEWLVISGCMYFLFRAFGPTASFSWNDTLVFTGVVAFGGAVQLPGVGGGLQVAAVLVLTELFQLPFEEATACALLVWMTSWLTAVPFGVVLAFKEGLQWRSLRAISDTVDSTAGSPAGKP